MGQQSFIRNSIPIIKLQKANKQLMESLTLEGDTSCGPKSKDHVQRRQLQAKMDM
jgi:hypothetical protein